jgi:hypothetical protein
VALPPGRYRLLVGLEGFETAQRDFDVTIDLDLDVSLTLSPAHELQSVEVRPAGPPPIEPAKTSLGRTITQRELEELPIPVGVPRNFATLAALTPGIQYDVASGASGGTAMGTAGQFGANTFLIDGLSIDGGMGGNLTNPPRDAIQEFRVVTNHISAEFGQASGAVINIVTRSGSNTPRGRLVWLQQAGALNARSWAAHETGTDEPGLTQSLFGGSWGGPLLRDRAFLFAAVERIVKHTSYINSSSVTPLFRPDDPTVVPFDVDFSRAQVRGDVHLGKTNVLTVRYGYDHVINGNAGREVESVAERSRRLRNPVHEVAVYDTHLFGSTVVHEIRAHVGRYKWFWTLDGFCDGCATVNYPSIKLGKPAGAPSTHSTDRGDLVDTLTWLLPGPAGRHTLKAGINVGVQRLVDAYLPNMTGTYSSFRGGDRPFNSSDSGTYPRQFTQNLGNPDVPVQQTIVSTFAQDEWRPLDNLWVNAGVRWDHTRWPGPSSRRDDVAPRAGLSVDPWKKGTTVFRTAAGRYYNESALGIARDVETGLISLTIDNPGYQGDVRHFDPYGPNPNRTGPAVGRYNVNRYVPTETPFVDQASAGVQHQVGREIGVSVDVVRARGRRLPVARDLNYPDPATGVRPYPDSTLRQIIASETRGESWYSGLQVGLQRRFRSHYGYSAAYAWSTAENNTDGPKAFPQDQTNLMADRGPVPNDARHQLTATGTVSGPRGLQLAAIVYARSALPYNITTGADDNRNGVTNDRPRGVGRNSARGSALFQADVRLSKVFLPAGRRLEVLVEAFNVFNRVNLTEYNGNASGREFGTPSSSGPPRQLQFGVRFDLDSRRR